ncbi:MAG: phage tail protein [Candidatus Wallbacteria bacterium]|nr:phage tail protein [Candidatus Wallbacteria bacterium]
MAEPFVGEIRLFSFDFAPQGWARCDGATLQVQQNQALFSLIGKMFGGNGVKTFMLPDLRGRVPAGTLPTSTLVGQALGAESVPLIASQTPGHTHAMQGTSSNGTQRFPASTPMLANAVVAPSSTPLMLYAQPGSTVVPMAPSAVSQTGGGQGHSNVQPSLALNFCIALTGIYPPRS